MSDLPSAKEYVSFLIEVRISLSAIHVRQELLER